MLGFVVRDLRCLFADMSKVATARLFCQKLCCQGSLPERVFAHTHCFLPEKLTLAWRLTFSLSLSNRFLSALAAKTATSSEDLGSKGPRPSPHLRPRPLPESISDTSPPKVVITSSSPRKTHQPSKRRSSKSSKPKVSTECKPLTLETRPHRSSESSSTSSADSKSDTGRPKRRDRQPTEGRAAPEPVEMVRVRSFVEHQALAATEKAAAPTCSPSASKARVKTRNSKSPAAVAAANAAEAASAASTVSITAPSAQQEALASLAAPLSKPIGPTGRWGRGQQPFK